MSNDYEYEYEVPDYGTITYPGSGHASPYTSGYKADNNDPDPAPKLTAAEIEELEEQRIEREAMRELIALRNKSTITASLTIMRNNKRLTPEQALSIAKDWWDKKNPEFTFKDYPEMTQKTCL